jgi:putative hydrolase of the HAD superfamily
VPRHSGVIVQIKGGIVDHWIRVVYFDLGGVYYTEGFREGLFAIARRHGIEEHRFYKTAKRVIFSNGYVRGEASERVFWDELASEAEIKEDLFAERALILAAFEPLPGMVTLVARTREQVPVGLLTDQCNWLYELNDRDNLLSAFDAVVSSYEEGYTKNDWEIFRIACQRMDVLPEEALFFDDNAGNVSKARDFGMRAYLFENTRQTEDVLVRECILP